ncbi:hypothetical protein F5J12DRAFT_113074 [Pisolithus orientalis]|uniref:uncharacterized protein n=1 Tax=Pisolithus orientalis TaxID=936130 RepID=UPI002224CF25|nr:uncharacterized protein F5J12DRAFT_113074 [Pisolithus orientalis]KAI6006251.1 hypothetical protein F5J12DRAFT_113074 [Pisolithus orientalis]
MEGLSIKTVCVRASIGSLNRMSPLTPVEALYGGKIGCAGNTKEKRERSMVVLLQWLLEMALAMRAPAVTSNKLCQVVTRLLKSLPVLVSVHAKRGSASSAQVRPQVVTTQNYCLLLTMHWLYWSKCPCLQILVRWMTLIRVQTWGNCLILPTHLWISDGVPGTHLVHRGPTARAIVRACLAQLHNRHYTQERDCSYERVRCREDLCLPSFPRRSPSPRWC